MLIVLPLLAILFQSPPQETPKDLQAVFETSAGIFIVQFYPDQAPNHVRKFLELAREGYFNGTSFHSMVARAVVQGGDPETKNPNARRNRAIHQGFQFVGRSEWRREFAFLW